MEVAKQAFAGELETRRDEIPIRSSPEIIPDGGAALPGAGDRAPAG